MYSVSFSTTKLPKYKVQFHSYIARLRHTSSQQYCKQWFFHGKLLMKPPMKIVQGVMINMKQLSYCMSQRDSGSLTIAKTSPSTHSTVHSCDMEFNETELFSSRSARSRHTYSGFPCFELIHSWPPTLASKGSYELCLYDSVRD